MPNVELCGRSANAAGSDGEKTEERRVQAGATWVPASYGKTPDHSVGWQNELGKFLVARALHKPSFWEPAVLLPGSYLYQKPQNYAVFLSYLGRVHKVNKYEILSAPPESLAWVPISGGQMVDNAVIGGRDEKGRKIYIGRAQLHDQTMDLNFWAPGKVQGESCLVAWNGREFSKTNYEILVGVTSDVPLPQGANFAEILGKSEDEELDGRKNSGLLGLLFRVGNFALKMGGTMLYSVSRGRPCFFVVLLAFVSMSYFVDSWAQAALQIAPVTDSVTVPAPEPLAIAQVVEQALSS